MLAKIRSFLAGSLPLSFSLSQSQLRMISTVGMGVLVGTSLIVIIPEGIETLYTSDEVGHSHTRRAIRDVVADVVADVRWRDGQLSAPTVSPPGIRRDLTRMEDIDTMPGPVIPDELLIDKDAVATEPPKTPTAPGVVGALGETTSPDKLDEDHAEKGTHHAWVGVSLIFGFILMYLIDTLPSLKPPPPPQRTNIYSLSDLSSASPSGPNSNSLPKGSFSTTLGLVIHAAADGIALGASSTQPSISFIVFFAIMVHKAPAAFGLTSILLKQGLGKRLARTHLVIFSLAAPIGAILTWTVVRILGGGGEGASGAASMKWWTGIILLFSGGTFL